MIARRAPSVRRALRGFLQVGCHSASMTPAGGSPTGSRTHRGVSTGVRLALSLLLGLMVAVVTVFAGAGNNGSCDSSVGGFRRLRGRGAAGTCRRDRAWQGRRVLRVSGTRTHPGQQPQFGVDALDPGVGKAVDQCGVDPRAMFADRPGELDERGLGGSSTQPVHKETVDGTSSPLLSTTLLEQYQRFTRLSTTTSCPDNHLAVKLRSTDWLGG
jgi:hypothetical protein